MHLSTVKIPINFGLDWFWSSLSFSILKPIFLPNLFAPFLNISSETRRLVRPSLAYDRISLGFWLNRSFVLNHRGAFMIDNRFCNRFINLGRPIFSLNHSGASAATVFTIPTTFGIAHALCYTRDEWATQSAARVGSLLFDFLTVPSTHCVPKIVFTFSPICRACKNSIAIYSITMRDLIFFLCIGTHQQSAIESSGWSW